MSKDERKKKMLNKSKKNNARQRPNLQKNDDADNLLIAYRNGDVASFDRIIEQFGQQVYNFIYKLVGTPEAAEDIFQDTFLRVLKNIENYQPKAKLQTWLIQIAKNLCYDYFKKENLIICLGLLLGVW